MREKKIEAIINTPRMSLHPKDEPNFSRGLYQLIKENFQPHFSVVEIGTYEGVTALLFGLTCKSVVTVDPFGEGYNFSQETKEDLIRAEKIAIKRLNVYPNIKMMKMTSEEFYLTLKIDNEFDAVYIDGDHTYEGVVADIINWKDHVNPGGFICGHDFGVPAVKDAITDTIGKCDAKFEDGSWLKKVV